jgi:putative membrane protein
MENLTPRHGQPKASHGGSPWRPPCAWVHAPPNSARLDGQEPPVANAPTQDKLGTRQFFILNAVLSTAALAVLAYILVVRPRPGEAPSVDLSFMPAVNAFFNACSAVCMCTALYFIRQGRRDLHRALMLTALGCSALFLLGYLAYHFVHGDTRYAGDGVLKTVYLAVLASHVLLSIFVLPLVLTTLYMSFSGRFPVHKKVARVTFPLWLYVSVTGVVIFFMLRGSLPAIH